MPKLKKGLVSGFIYAIEILVIVISLFPILWVILPHLRQTERF